MTSVTATAPRRWDVFCRVIDNLGDIGVCWRLAADLAERGQSVRLWTDDASALAWMAPGGAPGVSVQAWHAAAASSVDPGDVVVEAFGCDPPPGFVASMARRVPAPVWLNLEYLSAEPYAQRSHGLRSPQFGGPGAGLDKWFFYPGFAPQTGGLLREPGLIASRHGFDPAPWLARRGIDRLPGERLCSLFCYDNPGLEPLIDCLSRHPTRLLVTPGLAERQVTALLGSSMRRGQLQAHALPWLSQWDYDRLLWSCDLNMVRGEDSLVRAIWSGRPFLWQIYPQSDGAHVAKLGAFLDVWLEGASPKVQAEVRCAMRAWNRLAGDDFTQAEQSGDALGECVLGPGETGAAWALHASRRRHEWAGQPDLASQLMAYAASKAEVPG